jgi:hypothetical protein
MDIFPEGSNYELGDDEFADKRVINLSNSRDIGQITKQLMDVRDGADRTFVETVNLIERLAELRERWRLSPDQIALALFMRESRLSEDWDHEIAGENN